MNDWELLQQYAEGSQPAFAELVRRHLDFVFSCARRQVLSPDLAQEITQSVFGELARRAGDLDAQTPLAPWLYVVTRRASLNLLRADRRRRARENAAYELSSMNPPPSVWSRVEPLLDEALDTLNKHDRSALLLRFFENQSLRDVGAALGISDDAAQKRVSRAIDHLRSYFVRRGIAVSAAGLASDLSAHAIETAPAALGTAIAAGSTVALGTTVALETTRTIAMTTFHKTLFAATLALVIGAGVFEGHSFFLQRNELLAAHDEVGRLNKEVTQTGRSQFDLARQLALTQRQVANLRELSAAAGTTDPAMDAEMRAWAGRVDELKTALTSNPQWNIPEMRFLSEDDWYRRVQADQSDSPDWIRKSLGALRSIAMQRFSPGIMKALRAYLSAHGESPPDSIAALAPYFDTPVDPSLLGRYEIVHAESLGNTKFDADVARIFPPGSAILVSKPISDLEYDIVLQMSAQASMPRGALDYYAAKAKQAFAAANNGQMPTDPGQLLPYLPQPVDPAKLQQFLK